MYKTIRKSFLSLICFYLLFVACSCASKNENAKSQVISLFAQADINIGGKRAWDIVVHNDCFYDRVLLEGSIGLGESYVDGWWDVPELDQFMFRLLRAQLDKKVAPTWGMRWQAIKSYFCNLQDKLGAKEVIEEHYQLGNDLYQKMLDPLMVYSCAYWKEAKDLSHAQMAKFDLICRKLALKPGMRVLDIGCGWGGFAKYAALRYGVSVVGITLSENQAIYARELCRGLPVTIELKDYRDVQGKYDRVVSIGMFEHVGKKNYAHYMKIVHSCLKPGGLFLLHTIGTSVPAFVTDPWIHRYIFPNGELPAPTELGKSFEEYFVMEDWHNFGAYYDTTLMNWFARFDRAWPTLEARYDERFYRVWKYYLLSCAASFRARNIQLWQIVLSKEGRVGGYESIR